MMSQVAIHVGQDAAKKLMAGESLNATEKSHLADCEECMHRLVTLLDEFRKTQKNGELPHRRPSALKALEKGRQTFQREFGITLPSPQ
jgi:hypothetical protein